MDNILYNKGQIGFTAPGTKGLPGAGGYSVHFSTLSLETEATTILDCINNSKPLSNNTAFRGMYDTEHPYPETFNTDDIIIDDFGNFGVIEDSSIIIVGDIIRIDDDVENEISQYADLFAEAPTLEMINQSIPENLSYLSRNTYNYYKFIGNAGRVSIDGIDCPLYSHRDNIDTSTYGNFYSVALGSDTYGFLESALETSVFAKIMITFSTGLIYEKVFSSVNDFYAYLDNRYYYGYGRGSSTPADSGLTDPTSDSSWGGTADSSIWQNVSFIDRYYPGGTSGDTAETGDNLKNACRLINNDTEQKHSIVNAHVEFHTNDGYVFNVPLKLKENT